MSKNRPGLPNELADIPSYRQDNTRIKERKMNMNKAKLLIALSATLFWACSESTSEAGITEIENTMAQGESSSSGNDSEKIPSSSSQQEGADISSSSEQITSSSKPEESDISSSSGKPASSSQQSVSSSSEFSKVFAADTKNGYKLGSCLAGLGDEPILARPAAKIATLAEATQEETPEAYMLNDGNGNYQVFVLKVMDLCYVEADLLTKRSGDTLEIEYGPDRVESTCTCYSDHWFDIAPENKDIRYFKFSGKIYEIDPGPAPGPSKEVKKADEGPELTDARDGQVYKTIQLGEQTWMAENLNFEIEDGVQSWCNGNKGENCDKYGRLYTLAAAKTACPPDWHLPSVDEWPTKGNGGYSAFYAYGVEGWGNAKDEYGFAILPAGEYLADSKDFFEPGSFAHFWTSTIDALNHNCPKSVEVANGSSGMVAVCADNENDGYSVRCVKD